MEHSLKKDFENFLLSRHVPDEILNHMKHEKIDCQVVALMSDDELKTLFPSYGDRIAISDYCKRQMPMSQKKQSLLDRLRRKLGSKKKKRNLSSSSDENEVDHNSKKRKDYCESTTANKNKSQYRFVEIGWLHKQDNEFKQVRSRNGGGTRKVRVPKSADKKYLIEEGKKLFFPRGVSAKGLQLSKLTVNLLDFSAKALDEEITVETIFEEAKLTKLRVYLSTCPKCETVTSGDYDYEESHSFETLTQDSSHYIDDITLSPQTPQTINSDDTYNTPGDIIPVELTNYNLEEFLSLPVRPVTEETDRLLATQLQEEENTFTNDSNDVNNKIKLHRGQIFNELIKLFSEQEIIGCIQVQIILPNGEIEAGADYGGVWRDALSEFWESMIDRCTTGTNVKIPQLRHDFGNDKWVAIANILKKGWLSEKYFPIKISKVFMENCIFQKTFSNVRAEFLQFISEEEREILTEGLKDYDTINEEELADVLSRFDCKTLPNKTNLLRIVNEIAEQEIIQKPAFIINCFHEVLSDLVSAEELESIYRSCKPTSKNILGLLNFADVSTPEKEKVSQFLKKFIREVDDKLRMSFLRFCTGSNVALGESIKVVFIKSSGLQRTFVAHTCVNSIEVSENYDNYMEFRSELTSVLTSNIWVMDII